MACFDRQEVASYQQQVVVKRLGETVVATWRLKSTRTGRTKPDPASTFMPTEPESHQVGEQRKNSKARSFDSAQQVDYTC